MCLGLRSRSFGSVGIWRDGGSKVVRSERCWRWGSCFGWSLVDLCERRLLGDPLQVGGGLLDLSCGHTAGRRGGEITEERTVRLVLEVVESAHHRTLAVALVAHVYASDRSSFGLFLGGVDLACSQLGLTLLFLFEEQLALTSLLLLKGLLGLGTHPLLLLLLTLCIVGKILLGVGCKRGASGDRSAGKVVGGFAVVVRLSVDIRSIAGDGGGGGVDPSRSGKTGTQTCTRSCARRTAIDAGWCLKFCERIVDVGHGRVHHAWLSAGRRGLRSAENRRCVSGLIAESKVAVDRRVGKRKETGVTALVGALPPSVAVLIVLFDDKNAFSGLERDFIWVFCFEVVKCPDTIRRLSRGHIEKEQHTGDVQAANLARLFDCGIDGGVRSARCGFPRRMWQG